MSHATQGEPNTAEHLTRLLVIIIHHEIYQISHTAYSGGCYAQI